MVGHGTFGRGVVVWNGDGELEGRARCPSCVNLTDGPSLGAEVRSCLVDGTELTLWEDASGAPEPGVAFVRNEEGARCAVRLRDGTTGWVSSAYLDWAS